MKVNLTGYTDSVFVKRSDLFIDQFGLYYQVRKTISKSNINHNIWAIEYLKSINDNIEYALSPAEVLVHKYGFLYYSHDELVYKPIIKISNPKYFGTYSSEEQLDSLLEIMILNGENPFNVPMIMGEDNVYDYVEEERGKTYVKSIY